MAEEDWDDVEAMLEAPYRKDVSEHVVFKPLVTTPELRIKRPDFRPAVEISSVSRNASGGVADPSVFPPIPQYPRTYRVCWVSCSL